MARVADQTQRPEEFGRVAVLMGGRSAEREISLRTGGAVLGALQARGVDARAVDCGEDIFGQLAQGGFDRAFIALHGRGGEDGVLQGALEVLGIPYTGSGVLGSAITMDKVRTKQLWLGAGLPTPPFRAVAEERALAGLADAIGLPLIVKPVNEGSSIGMQKVSRAEDLLEAWRGARRFDDAVYAERWVDGAEYTASILGREVLPLIRIETAREFYDFDAKYHDTQTRYLCPCGLAGAQEEALKRLAWQAFETAGCQGWGRVDLFCDRQGAPWLIEVNTVPGLTDHSLVPKAAAAAGLSFEELIWRILETSIGRGPVPWR